MRCLNRISATCDRRRGTRRNRKHEGRELALLLWKNAHSQSRLHVEGIVIARGGGGPKDDGLTLLEVTFLEEATIGWWLTNVLVTQRFVRAILFPREGERTLPIL